MVEASFETTADGWGVMPGASLITDADQRIVTVNAAFCELTGYSEGELRGRNCRILQGPFTDRETVGEIREALAEGRMFRGLLLNQRKDGSLFWNLLAINPVKNADGELTHFVSTQFDITEVTERGRTTSMLIELANRLHDHAGRDEVAQAVADTVLALGTDRSAVAVVEPATGRLRMVAVRGWGERSRDALQFRAAIDGAPGLGAMLAEPSPRLFPENSCSWLAEVLRSYGNRAFVAAPMTSDGTAYGLILALWSSTPPPTALPDLLTERLTRIAWIGGVALRNAALIEQVQRAAQFDDLTGLANRRTTLMSC